MDLEAVAAAHAAELNKSISAGMKNISTNILIGLTVCAIAIAFKKK